MLDLTKCPNGHYYDRIKNESCPYCNRPEEEFFRRILEGAYVPLQRQPDPSRRCEEVRK